MPFVLTLLACGYSFFSSFRSCSREARSSGPPSPEEEMGNVTNHKQLVLGNQRPGDG